MSAVSHGASKHTQHFMERLYLKRKFTDTEIRCGSDSIDVHSCVLADSPVFEKMLQAPMIESTSRMIEISDFPAESVKQFLEVWYTGQCCTAANWSDILLLADKYELPDLVRISICNYISSKNI